MARLAAETQQKGSLGGQISSLCLPIGLWVEARGREKHKAKNEEPEAESWEAESKEPKGENGKLRDAEDLEQGAENEKREAEKEELGTEDQE